MFPCLTYGFTLLVLSLHGSVLANTVKRMNFSLVPSRPLPTDVKENLQGCHLGGKQFQLDERWSPIMEPQGLMVCVKCECTRVRKKGILQTQGLTVCHNIKRRCPDVTCANPKTLPGRCCKICTREDDIESNLTFQPNNPAPAVDDIEPEMSSDDSNTFHDTNVFYSVLSGASEHDKTIPGWSPTKTKAVATLRLTARPGQVLDFCVRWVRLSRPKYLEIVDEQGNIQLAKRLVDRWEGGQKACGTWNLVPSVYTTYLRKGLLFARITTAKYHDGVIAGVVKPDLYAKKELLSSVLAPLRRTGSGGMASLQYTPKGNLVHITITTRGLVFSGNKRKLIISIRHKSKTIFRSKRIILPKTGILTARWQLRRKRYMNLLARGKLHMRVSIGGRRVLPLMKGRIGMRLSCDAFQALAKQDSQSLLGQPGPPFVAGVRLMLGHNGELRYEVETQGIEERKELSIFLEGSRPQQTRHQVSKLSNGLYKKMDLASLHRLINNRMYVVITTGDGTWARGSLVSAQSLTLPHDNKAVWRTLPPEHVNSFPSFGGLSSDHPKDISSHVWLSYDATCQIRLGALTLDAGGRTTKVKVRLWRSLVGGKRQSIWARSGKSQFIRSYRYFESKMENIPEGFHLSLDRGYVFLQLLVDSGKQLFRTKNIQVRLPNQCWQRNTRVTGSSNPDTLNTLSLGDQGDMTAALPEEYHLAAIQENMAGENESDEPPPVCVFEGKSYPEGSAWLPDVDAKCTTCSCVKNKTVCERMICPRLECNNPIIYPGECCPSCPVTEEIPDEVKSMTCRLGQDPRKHRVFTTWHPYLPMEGFTSCALCECKAGGVAVCDKTPCPVLDCERSFWVKSEDDPCCYTCGATPITPSIMPFTTPVVTPAITPAIQPPIPSFVPTTRPVAILELPQRDINMEGACIVQGKIHQTGDTWHPVIQPFGFMKCFQCECKNQHVKCARLTCPTLTCAKKKHLPNVCCPVCEDHSASGLKGPDRTSDLKLIGLLDKSLTKHRHNGHDKLSLKSSLAASTRNKMFSKGGNILRDKVPTHPLSVNSVQRKYINSLHPETRKSKETSYTYIQHGRDGRNPSNLKPTVAENHPKRKHKKKGCYIGQEMFSHGARWRPKSSKTSDERCMVCRCRNGKTRCTFRCPKKCQTNKDSSPCCKHCKGYPPPSNDSERRPASTEVNLITFLQR